MATTYAPELVNTVLRGLRQQMLDDGWISELELQFAGPSPREPVSATRTHSPFGHHRASCAKAGVFSARGFADVSIK